MTPSFRLAASGAALLLASLAAFPAAADTSSAPSAPNASPAAPQDLRFRDFFVQPIGRQGLVLSPRLLAANGQRVRLVGFMVAEEEMPVGRFFFTPVPVRMSEQADGDADDLPPSTVVVHMPANDATRPLPHTPGLLALTGTLEVGREEMDDGRVTWVRLKLDPRAPESVAQATPR